MAVECPSTKDDLDSVKYDLVIIALPGVQWFIRESRTTGDLRAGSEIVAALMAEVVGVVTSRVGAGGGSWPAGGWGRSSGVRGSRCWRRGGGCGRLRVWSAPVVRCVV
jgi:hypothetical protein